MIKTIDDIHKMTIEKWGKLANINKAIQEHQEMIEALRDFKTAIAADNITQEVFDNIIEELGDCMNVDRKVEIIINIDHGVTVQSAKDKMKRTLDLMTKEDYVIDYGGIS